MFEFLPAHSGPMSCYTLATFTIMISAGIFFTTIYVRYNSNEFRRIEGWVKNEVKKLEIAIDGHDDYIDKTTSIINQIQIDLAVQDNSLTDIKDDLTEIKKDIKTLLKRE